MLLCTSLQVYKLLYFCISIYTSVLLYKCIYFYTSLEVYKLDDGGGEGPSRRRVWVFSKHVWTADWKSEMLKMSVKTSSWSAHTLRARPGTPSGPGHRQVRDTVGSRGLVWINPVKASAHISPGCDWCAGGPFAPPQPGSGSVHVGGMQTWSLACWVSFCSLWWFLVQPACSPTPLGPPASLRYW